MTIAQFLYLLLMGALFGLLIGVGLDPQVRRYAIIVLAVLLAVAAIAYHSERHKRE